MNLTTLVPAAGAVRLIGGLALVLAIAGAGAGLVWWGLSPRIDLARQEAAWSAEGLQKAHEMLQEKDDQLAAAGDQAARINQVDIVIAQMRDEIRQNNRAQSRALEELKQNDSKIVEYLRLPVPAGLGRLYERPETTDPAAYGSPALLRPDAVPSARAPSAGAQ